MGLEARGSQRGTIWPCKYTARSAKVRSCACIRFVQTHTLTRSRRWGERKRQVIRITLGLQRFTLKERRTKGHSIFFLLKDLRLLNYYSWAGKGTNLSFSLYFFFFFFCVSVLLISRLCTDDVICHLIRIIAVEQLKLKRS